MATIREELTALKAEVAALKEIMAGIQLDIDALKQANRNQNKDIRALTVRVTALESPPGAYGNYTDSY